MSRLRFVLAAALVGACDAAVYDKTGETLISIDSGYADVQERGATVMGVDQYTSQHVFESLPDGGRVLLERDDGTDTAAVRAIRAHMRQIERAFRAGDFSAPFKVHAQEVPGTRVMAAAVRPPRGRPRKAQAVEAQRSFGTTASVQRETQIGRCCSSTIRISHTWVLRPMCTGVAVPVTTPSFFARM